MSATTAHRSTDHLTVPRTGPTRIRRLRLVAAGLVIAGTTVLAWPWLTAPLAADERYMYLDVAGNADLSWPGLLQHLWEDTPQRIDTGRITPIGYLLQYVPYLAVVRFSAATGMPVGVGHTLTKLAMLALAVAALWWFLRVLRVRGQRLPTQVVRPLVVLVTVLFLLGGQTQVFHRSSWTAYPVLTTGAVVVAFGTVAACLTLADRLATSRRWVVPTLGVLGLLAVFLNLSYELYYVAVPLALLVLALHSPPQVAPAARWVQRRSRLVVGVVLTAFFSVGVLWVRGAMAATCHDPARQVPCYSGVDADLGLHTVVLAGRNLAGGVPFLGLGTARAQQEQEAPWLEAAGAPGAYGVAAAVAVAVGLLLLLHARDPGAGVDPARLRPPLVVVVLTGTAFAAGSALLMAIPARAAEMVTQVGEPYRPSTAVWAGLSLALLALAALAGSHSGRGLLRAPLALVLALTLAVGVFVWPTMAATIQGSAGTWEVSVVSRVHHSILSPDLSAAGEDERCALLDRLGARTGPGWRARVTRAAEDVFGDLWQRPYCAGRG